MPGGIHHPCASRVLLGERKGKWWERGTRKRNGDLSEACVRAIPCWCQFHSSSSMLRSFSLPQRENTPAGPERVRGRAREEGEEIRVIEIIGRQVQVQEEIEKQKQSERFVNITLHAPVMSNYIPFCTCSISIPPNNRASQYLFLCPL